MAIKRMTVFYSGRVQGVGFRYTTHRIARQYPVTGFVRNLPDGTVELMVSGSEDDVRQVIADVNQAFAGNISKADESVPASQAAFSRFEIRR